MDNKAMYKLSYGLFVLTSKANGKDVLLFTASEFSADKVDEFDTIAFYKRFVCFFYIWIQFL